MNDQEVDKFISCGVFESLKKITFSKIDSYEIQILEGVYRNLWTLCKIEKYSTLVYETFNQKLFFDLKHSKEFDLLRHIYSLFLNFTLWNETTNLLHTSLQWKHFLVSLQHQQKSIRKTSTLIIYNMSLSDCMDDIVHADPLQQILGIVLELISKQTSCNFINLILRMYCSKTPQHNKLSKIREYGFEFLIYLFI